MGTAVLQTTHAQDTTDLLLFGHRWLFKRVDLTEESWNYMMFEYGRHYAYLFAAMFDDKSEWLYDYLLKSEPEPGDDHNFFWMWFKYKWMQNDYEYISNKVYEQPIEYNHYKTIFLQAPHLDEDLLSLLQSQILQ